MTLNNTSMYCWEFVRVVYLRIGTFMFSWAHMNSVGPLLLLIVEKPNTKDKKMFPKLVEKIAYQSKTFPTLNKNKKLSERVQFFFHIFTKEYHLHVNL